jgi:photosystem II stability/assembly factor-like uncharacterized protein
MRTAWNIFLFLALPATVQLASGQWLEFPGPDAGTIASFTYSHGMLFAGNPGGVFRSPDLGISWSAVNEGLTDLAVWSLTAHRGFLFVGTNDSGVFRSSDDGLQWHPARSGLTDTHVRALATDGNALYVGTLGGVFRSLDDGASWVAMDAGMTTPYVRTLACARGGVLAGTLGGGVYVSDDSGRTWSERNLGLTNTSVMSIAISGSRIFAGTYGGLFMSTNDGARWMKLDPTGVNPIPRIGPGAEPTSAFLEPKTVYTLAVYGQRVFIAMMEKGVYTSTDGGATWESLNGGLVNRSFYSIYVTSSDLYVGGFGGGIGRLPLKELATKVDDAEEEEPEAVSLSQNFPNPFNPTTSIRYQIPPARPSEARVMISLEVFDLLGQRVATLVNEEQSSGSHTVTWDATGVVSGTYVYRLKVGSVTRSRAMVLLR